MPIIQFIQFQSDDRSPKAKLTFKFQNRVFLNFIKIKREAKVQSDDLLKNPRILIKEIIVNVHCLFTMSGTILCTLRVTHVPRQPQTRYVIKSIFR